MSNMSYCRYENTSADMQDCLDAIRYDGLNGLSGSERKCAHELYEAAMKYIVEYESNSDIIARWVETPNGGKVLTSFKKKTSNEETIYNIPTPRPAKATRNDAKGVSRQVWHTATAHSRD